MRACLATVICWIGTGAYAANSKGSDISEPTIRVLLSETSGTVTLPLEEYLRGVVPSEIGAAAPEQAQCAQAVAARSFAAVALRNPKHRDKNCDVCSTVHCQVYSKAKITSTTDVAVSKTRGLVLTYSGKPIAAYYAALCGGHTEDIRNVWPERTSERAYHGIAQFDGAGKPEYDLTDEKQFRSWLAASPVVYCNPDQSEAPGWTARNFRWTRTFKAEEVSTFVAKLKDIGRVLKIRAGARGESGRLKNVELIGERGSLRVGPQLEIRELFQPMLRSSAFCVDTSGPLERPTHFVLHGAGSGHGVGMVGSPGTELEFAL